MSQFLIYFLIQIQQEKFKYPIQGGGSGLSLTQNSWFNACHGLFSPLTLIINTNTLSLKHLMNILPTFHLHMHFSMF